MQRLEVSGAVRPLEESLGVKGLNTNVLHLTEIGWERADRLSARSRGRVLRRRSGLFVWRCEIARFVSKLLTL